jgi:hypothetical protein
VTAKVHRPILVLAPYPYVFRSIAKPRFLLPEQGVNTSGS